MVAWRRGVNNDRQRLFFFFHCAWLCTKRSLSAIISAPFQPRSQQLKFHWTLNCVYLTSTSGSLNNARLKFMEVVLCVAEKCRETPIPLFLLIGGLLNMKIHINTYCLRKHFDTFLKIWQSYLDHTVTSLTLTKSIMFSLVIFILNISTTKKTTKNYANITNNAIQEEWITNVAKENNKQKKRQKCEQIRKGVRSKNLCPPTPPVTYAEWILAAFYVLNYSYIENNKSAI